MMKSRKLDIDITEHDEKRLRDKLFISNIPGAGARKRAKPTRYCYAFS